jgi:hypothetical protein
MFRRKKKAEAKEDGVQGQDEKHGSAEPYATLVHDMIVHVFRTGINSVT